MCLFFQIDYQLNNSSTVHLITLRLYLSTRQELPFLKQCYLPFCIFYIHVYCIDYIPVHTSFSSHKLLRLKCKLSLFLILKLKGVGGLAQLLVTSYETVPNDPMFESP